MLKATVDGNTEVIEGILRDIHNSEILILSIFIYFSIIFLYNYYMKSLFMKLGDFIDFVLGGVSMSDKINRKVELYRVEILNNDDRNDMYSKKIILEDLLVDFFNSSKYDEKNKVSFKVNSNKMYWIEYVNSINENNHSLIEVKLTYSKYNKEVTIVNVNTRKKEGQKNKKQGDLEKLHLTIRFFENQNAALIIFEKVIDSIPITELKKDINRYFKKTFLKKAEYDKDPKVNSVILNINPIANSDFMENVSNLKSIKLLQTTVLKESVDDDIKFSSDGMERDDVDLIVRAKPKKCFKKSDVVTYCNKFISNGTIRGNKVKRIIICGVGNDNNPVRLDTDGMKLYRTLNIQLDDNNTIDTDDIFLNFKDVIINNNDEIMELFNVTIEEAATCEE